MTYIRTSTPYFLILQNLLAIGILVPLLLANSVAGLLYLHPASELLWRIALPLNRMAEPVTNVIGLLPGHSLINSLLICAAALALPVYALRQRHLFTSAVSGHLSLAAGAFAVMSTLRWPSTDQVAYIGEGWPHIGLTPSSPPLIAVIAVAAFLCMLNHIVYISRLREHG